MRTLVIGLLLTYTLVALAERIFSLWLIMDVPKNFQNWLASVVEPNSTSGWYFRDILYHYPCMVAAYILQGLNGKDFNPRGDLSFMEPS